MRLVSLRSSQDGAAPVLVGASDVVNARASDVAHNYPTVRRRAAREVRLRNRVKSTPNSYDGHAAAIYLIPTGSPTGD